MPKVKTRQPDRDKMVDVKAADFAEEQYGREFEDLPPDIQMIVRWLPSRR